MELHKVFCCAFISKGDMLVLAGVELILSQWLVQACVLDLC